MKKYINKFRLEKIVEIINSEMKQLLLTAYINLTPVCIYK